MHASLPVGLHYDGIYRRKEENKRPVVQAFGCCWIQDFRSSYVHLAPTGLVNYREACFQIAIAKWLRYNYEQGGKGHGV
jgi:hypothetical protein